MPSIDLPIGVGVLSSPNEMASCVVGVELVTGILTSRLVLDQPALFVVGEGFDLLRDAVSDRAISW